MLWDQGRLSRVGLEVILLVFNAADPGQSACIVFDSVFFAFSMYLNCCVNYIMYIPLIASDSLNIIFLICPHLNFCSGTPGNPGMLKSLLVKNN